MKVTITVEDGAVVETKTDGTAKKATKPPGDPSKESGSGVTVHMTQPTGEPKVVPVPEPLATILRSVLD
jgi:hypothetical protein